MWLPGRGGSAPPVGNADFHRPASGAQPPTPPASNQQMRPPQIRPALHFANDPARAYVERPDKATLIVIILCTAAGLAIFISAGLFSKSFTVALAVGLGLVLTILSFVLGLMLRIFHRNPFSVLAVSSVVFLLVAILCLVAVQVRDNRKH